MDSKIDNVFYNTCDFALTETLLGKGTIGRVYLAERKKDKKKFVVKIINTEGGISGDLQMSLIQESINAKKLHHQCLVKFNGINFQSFTNSDKLQPSIINDYLPNGPLKTIFNESNKGPGNRRWTMSKKYICLIGISNSLHYLHQNGVFHGNLKPENVLFDDDYNPYLSDFCFSNCFPQIPKSKENLIYIAPEILKGTKNYDQYGADVYSFGILAYSIVAGKEAYSELDSKITLDELKQKIIGGYRPKFNNKFTKKMKDLILSCLNEKYNERPTFEQIYSKLSKNFNYFKDYLDDEEVNEFINKLTNDGIPNELNYNVESLIKKFDEERNYYTNIIKALSRNTRNIMDILFRENGYDLNILQYACYTGNVDIVKYLISLKKFDITRPVISNYYIFKFNLKFIFFKFR